MRRLAEKNVSEVSSLAPPTRPFPVAVECRCGFDVTSLKAFLRVRSMASDEECSDLQSSTGDSTSHLSYSLQESEESEGEENVNALRTVDPYEYEPVASDSPAESQEDSDNSERLNNMEWLV